MVAQGTTLAARYRLDSRIGAGGMGEVWRGEDIVLARTVAVKVLLPGRTDDPGFLVRFQGEARAMATINHPGVVDVYDYGIHEVPGAGATAYLVMKFVDGEPLDRLLGRLGSIAPAAAMDLIAQAASALQAVHDQGIVHRDIKPGNLLVRSDGTLVLTDFGIARSDAASRLTDAGMVLGTAAYCAPEQAEGAPVTPAVDIYALGVVAYECLAGRRPFEGDTPVTVALKHIREMPPPLPQHIPPAIRALVEQSLAKDPARRFPSAMAMSNAARQSILGLGPESVSDLQPSHQAESARETGWQAAQPAQQGWQGQTAAVGAQADWQGQAAEGAQTGWQGSVAAPTGSWQGAQTGTMPPAGPAVETASTVQGRRAAKKPRRKGPLVAVFAAAGVVCVGLVALALNGTAASTPNEDVAMTSPPPSVSEPSSSPKPSRRRVPDVMGLAPETAQLQLKKVGMRATVIPSAGVDDSQCTKVVRQTPEAKTLWDPKREVELVIDACPEQSAEPTPTPPTLAFPAPPAGKAGEKYSVSLAVDGGTEPYAWSVSAGKPPPGLTLNASTGVLSGVPAKAGIYPFTVRVTDADDASATQAVKLVIGSGQTPTPTPTITPVVRKKVPNVVGMTPEAAKAQLAKAGLQTVISDGSGGEHSQCQVVVQQDPGVDTLWDVKKPVDITVISKPCPPPATPTPTSTSGQSRTQG
ncbi:serine/threonine-protein kinase [Streptosporangium lutulentum]|uniref:non-specific serine/threonine protein kinase n=1 Tax=Streptosporangium lutulentum TaxID=1461250 RepID=A0ABT9QR16_9ACTN|nr:serine/threonine-protein kinase [Streptosporangium lutulentum]MDP9849190.1 serine/threonine-protein kinase [Streptosporangium lutulentum]